jgi:hypothetical protein
MMGADNQAERVTARIEFREGLAKIFHDAFRATFGWDSNWDTLAPDHTRPMIAGVTAVVDEINRRMAATSSDERQQDALVNVNRAYVDPTCDERACDHCGKLYRGPSVYCSFECAMADA